MKINEITEAVRKPEYKDLTDKLNNKNYIVRLDPDRKPWQRNAPDQADPANEYQFNVLGPTREKVGVAFYNTKTDALYVDFGNAAAFGAKNLVIDDNDHQMVKSARSQIRQAS